MKVSVLFESASGDLVRPIQAAQQLKGMLRVAAGFPQAQATSLAEKDVNAIVAPFNGNLVLRFDNTGSFLSSQKALWSSRCAKVSDSLWLSQDPAITARPIPLADKHLAHILADIDRDMAFCALDDIATVNSIAMRGVHLFFSNRFGWAETSYRRHFRRSPIMSLAYATIHMMRAIMSWNEADIVESRRRAAHVEELSAAMQPSSSWFGSSEPVTPAQAEGLLVGAEASLISAFLHILDESLLAFAKCGVVIHSGLGLYSKLDAALGGIVARTSGPDKIEDAVVLEPSADSAAYAVDFIAARAAGLPGVAGAGAAAPDAGAAASAAKQSNGMPAALVSGGLFGTGMFNLMTASLPDLVLRVVQFFGVPSCKPAGLAQLKACMRGRSIRAPLAAMALLIEFVQLPSFVSDPHIRRASAAAAEDVLASAFQSFPTSAFFMWNAGRSERMRWSLGLADALFAECGRLAAASDKFKALANVSAYDRAFCFLFLAPAGNALAAQLLKPPSELPAYLANSRLGRLLACEHSTAVEPVAAAGAASAGGSPSEVPPPRVPEQKSSAAARDMATYDWTLKPYAALASGRFQSCWHLAESQFEFLQESDLWSRAFFSYMTAICRAERGHIAAAAAQFDVVQQQLGRKLAGKRISAEQFIVRKVDVWRRSLASGHAVLHSALADASVEKHGAQAPGVPSAGAPRYLMLPGLESMYLFNGFSCMHPAVARSALLDIDDALLQLAGATMPLTAPSEHAPVGAVRERYCIPADATRQQVTALLDAAFVGSTPDDVQALVQLGTYQTESDLASGGDVPVGAAMAAGGVAAAAAPGASEAVQGGALSKRGTQRRSLIGSSSDSRSLPHPADSMHACGTPRADLVAVAALLRGSALVAAGSVDAALACFMWIREHKSDIIEDTYTLPFAYYEMATVLGPCAEGQAMLKRAQDFGADYNFKMRLHLRLHLLGQSFKRAQEAAASQ